MSPFSLAVALFVVAALRAGSQDTRSLPPEAVKHFQAGMAAKKARRLGEAIVEFKEAIQLCPHYVDAHWGLAWAWAESDLKDHAIEAFRQVIAHDICGEKMRMALDALLKLNGDLPKRTFLQPLDGSQRRCVGLPVVPVESPRGGKLLFAWKYEHQTLPDIYIANVAGEVTDSLTKTPGVWERSPAWSPDGARVAYGFQSSATSGGLSVLDLVSRETVTLVNDMLCDDPAWSPDGQKIAFQGAGQLWVVAADGSARYPLTGRGDRARAPHFSPDGSQIVYQAWTGGQWRLFTTSTEGGEPNQLTYGPGHDFAPLWLPDGGKILFASKRDSRGENAASDLYLLDPATGIIERLTDTPESEGETSLAADGRSVYVQAVLPRP